MLCCVQESLPHARLAERWAQLAIQLALSCSSRHYAGNLFRNSGSGPAVYLMVYLLRFLPLC
jgi:hypothetical protein